MILQILRSLFLVKESGLNEGCKELLKPPGKSGTFSKFGKIAILLYLGIKLSFDVKTLKQPMGLSFFHFDHLSLV